MRSGVRIFFVQVILTLALLFQSSHCQFLFPAGGGPDLVLAALLIVGMRLGLMGSVVTGFWGGLVLGALRGTGMGANAALYLAVGWLIGMIREVKGRPRPIKLLLLAGMLSLVVTAAEAWLTGGTSMWRCALASLAPQIFVQVCVVAFDEIVLGFLN
jgi:rod shape-determining protein MreD